MGSGNAEIFAKVQESCAESNVRLSFFEPDGRAAKPRTCAIA